MANPLSNTNFLTITANLSPAAPAVQSFNIPCFVDNTGILTTASQRTQHYTSIAAIETAGFASNSTAVAQAQVAFAQTYPPPYVVIGNQDTTALATIIIHSGNAGTGYAAGDTFSISSHGGVGRVTTVSTGVPTAISIVTQGSGYSVTTGATTTAITGSGTGLEVDISAIGETPLQSVTAIRNADSSWYTIFCSTAVDADHQAIAAWAEAQTTPTWYNITTGEAAVLNGTAGNIALLLQAATYNHTSIQYATTQSGLQPTNIYASLGQTTDFINRNSVSNATATFKSEAGVGFEPLTQSQYQTIVAENCNVLGQFQAGNFIAPGIMCGGWRMFQRIGVDALLAQIQSNIFTVFLQNPKVAQTNDGEAMFISAVNSACEASVTSGFIARTAVWQGVAIPVLDLAPGDQLPKGYLTGAASFTTQSPSDRSALKGMPITCVIGLAGSIENIAINVLVQQ